MGNQAKYWFRGKIIISEDVEVTLKAMGFTDVNNDEKINENAMIQIERILERMELVFLYADESNISWKNCFEKYCADNNIPIQKWMMG